MFHAVTIPRVGFLRTIVYTNTSFRGTEGDGGSTTRYEALRRGCEQSKVSMKCKRSKVSMKCERSKALRDDDLKLRDNDLKVMEDDDPWIEDHLKTVERIKWTASDVEEIERNVHEQTKNGIQRLSIVEESASTLDERASNLSERASNLCERARIVGEQSENLISRLNLLEERLESAIRYCHTVHIQNFMAFCVGIFIDGTEEERSRGTQYASYEDWVNAQTTPAVSILTTEGDVFGPRTLTVPIDALRTVQQAKESVVACWSPQVMCA